MQDTNQGLTKKHVQVTITLNLPPPLSNSINTGDYYCQCNAGYKSGSNNKTCTVNVHIFQIVRQDIFAMDANPIISP